MEIQGHFPYFGGNTGTLPIFINTKKKRKNNAGSVPVFFSGAQEKGEISIVSPYFWKVIGRNGKPC